MFQIFLDSDGPIADFDKDLIKSGAHCDDFKHWPGTYLWLSKTAGAEASLILLKELEDLGKLKVWILTKTPKGSPYAYSEKVLWYRQHFPWLEDRIILTQDKSLVGKPGDYLLDDRPHKGNAFNFSGNFVFFDVLDEVGSWNKFVSLINERVNTLV